MTATEMVTAVAAAAESAMNMDNMAQGEGATSSANTAQRVVVGEHHTQELGPALRRE